MGEVDDLDDHSHCSSIAQDLAAALDFLVVVTAIRQRVISPGELWARIRRESHAVRAPFHGVPIEGGGGVFLDHTKSEYRLDTRTVTWSWACLSQCCGWCV